MKKNIKNIVVYSSAVVTLGVSIGYYLSKKKESEVNVEENPMPTSWAHNFINEVHNKLQSVESLEDMKINVNEVIKEKKLERKYTKIK